MSLSNVLKQPVRRMLRYCGYDIVPYPLDAWTEQRLTLGRHLNRLFSHARIDCVLDVGSNDGGYGAFLREIGYRGLIVSFEPVSETFQRLKRRAGNDRDWRTFQMALGARDGEAAINVFRSTELSSFLEPNEYCANHMGGSDLISQTEWVKVRRLDSVIEECINGTTPRRFYLKLDTQGYDLNVVEGCGRYLGHMVALQSELSVKPIYRQMTNYLTALATLSEAGFEVSGMFPVNRDADLRVIELDCVMVRVTGATLAEDLGELRTDIVSADAKLEGETHERL